RPPPLSTRCPYTTLFRSRRWVPYSPHNNLIKNEVVLLPSEPEEYGSEDELLAAIQDFIHRYVDVSPLFEKTASYYVLLSWVYDGDRKSTRLNSSHVSISY